MPDTVSGSSAPALHPAVDTARSYVQSKIDDATWRTGDRLPTTRELAQCAGVSIASMAKAIGEFKEKGALFARTRKGIFLGKPSEKQRVPASEEVRRRLMRDIAEARYAALPYLPSCKELGETYGVCFSTLRMILDRLAADGVIARHKKRYSIRRQTAAPGTTSILLILSRELYNFVEKFYFLRTRILSFLRAMEHECSHRKINLIIKGFSGDTDILHGMREVIGTIITLFPYQPDAQKTNELIRALLTFKKPVFIADNDEWAVCGDLPKSPYLYFSSESGIGPAMEIGRFLISKGHRRVCFFAHEPGLVWSDVRIKGMTQAFESAGFRDAVEVMYGANPRNLPVDKGYVAPPNVPQSAKTQRHMRYFERQKRYLRAEFPGSPACERVIAEMDEMSISLRGTWDRFIPLCERALAHGTATAWVAAEDQIAVLALYPFLKRKRLSAPRDISIVGFNNIPESLSHGLTTYDFNPAAAGLLAIDFFVSPDHAPAYVDKKNNRIRDGGYIVDRGSVGTVR